MTKKYDVCAVGNALVDYEIEVEDQFFTDNKVEKGFMTLVEESRQAALLSLVKGKIRNKQGGGSAANTVFGLSEFGGKGFYSCKVADDQDGALFVKDLNEAGIGTNLDTKALHQGTTGKCLVMVSPDAERTMNTYLGISSDFSTAELDEAAISESTYLFMEGFLVSTPKGHEAMKVAKQIAQKAGTKISLSFSDPSMVKYFKKEMQEVVAGGIDLLFCNIEEGELFTETKGLEAVKESLKSVAKRFVITCGDKGALAFDGEHFVEIDPFPTKAIDATGAGDMFAGAFLYGITHGMSFAEAGRLASSASSEVVGKYGPRIDAELITKIRGRLS